ncbi:oxidative stress defense protein [Proteus myxofaciens]|uniref:Uncharacterized DUF541 family protein n=1 Tax=Proteus myxofaciens ATCC 19692 TaxID=1354337 RepID=A0A198GFC9_9GAMM|nr:oxidative stress defense protein [Proteus myxofaciens]OAT34921.1 uncharacterized DUF541 family protein [Proteus myxofaciens ATCC 19692]
MKLKTIALASVLALGLPSIALAASEPEGAHITTSGNSTIKAVPDMATINIQVSETAKDAAGAKKQVDERVAKYFDFLKENGVEKADINAANIRTQPNYEYDKKSERSVIKGYSATRTVDVKIKNLDKLNTLLDGALSAGLNEITNVEFGVNNPEQYKAKAREEAIKNAITQASSVAKGFGSDLGAVYSISYRAPDATPYPIARMKANFMAAPADVAVQETYEQQSIEFKDNVDVVFELKRAK